MWWAALAVLACGCNQVFDLQSTKLVDARDITIDVPRQCPAIGTPLSLGRELHQVVRQDCQGYTTSSATKQALATCYESAPTYGYFGYEGEIDGDMQKFEIGLSYVDVVRLFPEGNRMLVRGYDAVKGQVAAIFERNTDNVWTATADPVPPALSSYSVGTITTAPDRRMLINTSTSVEEHGVGLDGTWVLVHSYAVADFGCANVYGATLTPDGLRMLVSCYRTDNNKTETRYAERMTRADLFGPLQTIYGAPQGVYMMVMSDDCARVYFSALQSVFAAELD